MFQILFDHLFRHLPNCGAKIATRPKMLPPVTLLQMRKLFKQIIRSPSFNPSHDFTGRHSQRCIDQNMDMIFTHYSSDYPNFKRLTSLPDQLSNSFRYLTSQNFVAVFGYPNKMILNLKDCMTTISLFHRSPRCPLLSQLKPVV